MKRIACLLMLTLPGVAMGSDRIVEETFDAREDARLELESHKGKIHIEAGDVSTIQMKARIYPDEGPVEDLQYVEIRTTHSDRSVSIEVDYDIDSMSRSRYGESGDGGSWQSTSLPFVDFDIVVPWGASLDLESHKSSFDVQAPTGNIKISTHKGHGKISSVRNDFELETHKGDFEIEIEEMGDTDIETHKGQIDVILHGASDFRIRGETHKGNLEFEGQDVQVHRDDDHGYWVSETFGSGEHLVTLGTHKGRIKLNFRM